jgi:hypothetical protein
LAFRFLKKRRIKAGRKIVKAAGRDESVIRKAQLEGL